MFEGRSLIDRPIAIRITDQTTRVGVATFPGHPADSIEVAVAALAEAVPAAAESDVQVLVCGAPCRLKHRRSGVRS